ncbi:hypothetical protein GOODEAATRI_029981 [Goodea atripinnis]|uniref:Uncharacterized protein n=1 Tax=Goodea atripinnis TaxID=208336 RepID=A0ABV0N5C5_9TELE
MLHRCTHQAEVDPDSEDTGVETLVDPESNNMTKRSIAGGVDNQDIKNDAVFIPLHGTPDHQGEPCRCHNNHEQCKTLHQFNTTVAILRIPARCPSTRGSGVLLQK